MAPAYPMHPAGGHDLTSPRLRTGTAFRTPLDLRRELASGSRPSIVILTASGRSPRRRSPSFTARPARLSSTTATTGAAAGRALARCSTFVAPPCRVRDRGRAGPLAGTGLTRALASRPRLVRKPPPSSGTPHLTEGARPWAGARLFPEGCRAPNWSMRRKRTCRAKHRPAERVPHRLQEPAPTGSGFKSCPSARPSRTTKEA